MHPAGRATAAGSSCTRASREEAKGREKKVEETSREAPTERAGQARFSNKQLLVLHTSALGRPNPGYIVRGMGMGPLTKPQVAHACPVVGEGWEDLGASQPAQWRWRQMDVRE